MISPRRPSVTLKDHLRNEIQNKDSLQAELIKCNSHRESFEKKILEFQSLNNTDHEEKVDGLRKDKEIVEVISA
jgi:hypothetical protein